MPTGFLYCKGLVILGLPLQGFWSQSPGTRVQSVCLQKKGTGLGTESLTASLAPSQSCSSALRASRPRLSWNSLSQRSFCLYQEGRLPKEVVTRKQSKNCYSWMRETFSLVLHPAKISTFQEGPPGIVLCPLASPMSLQVPPPPNTFPSSYLGMDLI